jgi:predicted MFS family arabinose efflux permease
VAWYVVAAIATSAFGTWGYNVAIAVYAYETTHSATWVAIVTVGRYVPAIVLSWLAAGLVDRVPRRALVMGTDLVCGAIMLALGAMAAADSPLLLLTVVAALSSTTARIQASAVLSVAADIVAESQLGRASSLAAAAEAVAAAAGSAAVSVLLVHFAPSSVFVLNALTFVASAALISQIPSVPVRHSSAAVGEPTPMSEPAPSVVRVRLWPLQASRTLAAYLYGTDIVLLAVIASEHLGSGTSGYGWLLAAAGLGGLVAALPRLRLGSGSTAHTSTAGVLLYALPLLVFTAHPAFATGIGTQVVRGAGSVLVTSKVIAALQRSAPSAVAGRVFGRTQSLVLIGTCVGAVTTPAMLHWIGFTATVVVAALVPCVGQLLLHPLLVQFGRQESVLLAALDPRLATLRELDLLRAASRSTLYELANAIDVVAVEPGEVVVREGGPSDALFVLVSGRVEVTAAQGAAGSTVLREMRAPDHFGEIGLLSGTPRTATVTALEQCELWRIPADTFLSAVSHAGVSSALEETTRMRRSFVPHALLTSPSV